MPQRGRVTAGVLIEIKGEVLSVAVMKALIVDESGRTSARLQPALAQEGYVVQAASQRGEALWLASEAEPDVIVICSARPGTHDVPVVTALRGDGERAPILVMARRGESADLVDVLDAGADDVVTSPVPFAEVAARLRALTRRAPHLVEDELRVGTLRLDRAARVAVRTLDDATIGDAGIDHASIGDALAEPGGATTRDVVSGAQRGEVAIDSPPASTPSSNCSCATRGTWCHARASSTTSGAGSMRRRRTSSTRSSAICGASSTARSVATTSRRCVASATASSTQPLSSTASCDARPDGPHPRPARAARRPVRTNPDGGVTGTTHRAERSYVAQQLELAAQGEVPAWLYNSRAAASCTDAGAYLAFE